MTLRRLLAFGIAALSLISCTHKELCLSHPHTRTISVAFDWIDAPDASPRGMCVYFYPLDGGPGERFDLPGTDGGEVKVRVGKYRVLAYNNDTEAVQFFGTDDFDRHGAFTRDGHVLEPIYGSALNWTPKSESGEERVVICPDMMWGCTSEYVEINEEGIVSICRPKTRHTETEPADDARTLTLYPHELTCTYTVEVRNVTNLKHLSQICGNISGMSGAFSFASESLSDEPVTLPFSADKSGTSSVTGRFHTFGPTPDLLKPHKMSFYVVMDDGQKYVYQDTPALDVTQQVHSAPDPRHVHIIIDGLPLPTPIENGNGFRPSVDDWEDIKEDIIL